jgi:hypothetical protein
MLSRIVKKKYEKKQTGEINYVSSETYSQLQHFKRRSSASFVQRSGAVGLITDNNPSIYP